MEWEWGRIWMNECLIRAWEGQHMALIHTHPERSRWVREREKSATHTEKKNSANYNVDDWRRRFYFSSFCGCRRGAAEHPKQQQQWERSWWLWINLRMERRVDSRRRRRRKEEWSKDSVHGHSVSLSFEPEYMNVFFIFATERAIRDRRRTSNDDDITHIRICC